jgi:geranylgeranyl diphosphate synthase type 3
MQLLNILKQRSEDEDVKRYAIQYIESTGSFDYSFEKLSILLESARAIIKEIEADVCYSPEIHAIMNMLDLR